MFRQLAEHSAEAEQEWIEEKLHVPSVPLNCYKYNTIQTVAIPVHIGGLRCRKLAERAEQAEHLERPVSGRHRVAGRRCGARVGL